MSLVGQLSNLVTRLGTEFKTIRTEIALKAPVASPALTGAPTAPTQAGGDNSTKLATTAYVKTADDATLVTAQAYSDALLDANNAYVYKGSIDASANPNYPAANAGHTYKISVAGKIGGAAGIVIEAGDTATCIVDASAAGNQATVGANWIIVQTNIDGAVVGPAASTSLNITTFSGATGKVVQDSGVSFDTDTALTANSDAKVSTQKAVKTYVGDATTDFVAAFNAALV